MQQGDNTVQHKSKYEIEITKDLTISKLFYKKAHQYGKNRVAMREKEFGIWRPITWHDYFENVKYLALGLLSLGLENGDKVSMIGDNRPEGLWAEMATLCAGGIGVWLFQDSLIEEVKYIIDHSDTKFLFGEGQEEVDKAISIFNECPKLEKIIWDDPKGMRNYDQDYLISLKQLQQLGRELEQQQPHLFKEMIDKGHGDDVALLFYTSGTTALPKGALLSHNNMLTMGKHLMAVDPCFATQDNIREIGPHVMFAPPRMYEQMTRTVQVKYLDATWIKRKLYELSTRIGYHVADLKFQKKSIPWYWAFLDWLAYIAVQKKLKDHLGLSQVRNAYTGGAAMGPDHFRFFHALGVNLKQIYGQTEVAGISVVHRSGDIKFDTVGLPIPETEIKITEEGEILTRSPSVFLGYYKNPEATEETLKDGWLYSGDRGFIDDDGHLVVFDRTKDVFTLRDGRPFSPQYLETRLKFSPYVKDSWVIGDKKDYIAAVICIDYSVAGKWADEKKINYTSYQELSQLDQIYNLVEAQIRKANKDLPESARVVKFVNLYKEFDADDDELTRTRKLRRAFVEKRYHNIVDALYSENNMVHIDTTITYENGRQAHIKSNLHIRKVADLQLSIDN